MRPGRGRVRSVFRSPAQPGQSVASIASRNRSMTAGSPRSSGVRQSRSRTNGSTPALRCDRWASAGHHRTPARKSVRLSPDSMGMSGESLTYDWSGVPAGVLPQRPPARQADRAGPPPPRRRPHPRSESGVRPDLSSSENHSPGPVRTGGSAGPHRRAAGRAGSDRGLAFLLLVARSDFAIL
jgi:hypothetical protein